MQYEQVLKRVFATKKITYSSNTNIHFFAIDYKVLLIEMFKFFYSRPLSGERKYVVLRVCYTNRFKIVLSKCKKLLWRKIKLLESLLQTNRFGNFIAIYFDYISKIFNSYRDLGHGIYNPSLYRHLNLKQTLTKST